MNRKNRIRSVAAVASAALVAAGLALGASPAMADKVLKDDPHHDKWVSKRDGVLEGNPKPSDVNQMLAQFKSNVIIVRLQFNNLHPGSASGFRYDVTTKKGPSNRFFGAKQGYEPGVYKSKGDGKWEAVCVPVRIERFEGPSTGSAHHGRLYLNAPIDCFVPNDTPEMENSLKVHAEVFDQTDGGYRYWHDTVSVNHWVDKP